jgi:hypothetical protein
VGNHADWSFHAAANTKEKMMIRFVRTASIAPGKLGDAIAFAKQVSVLIEKIAKVKLEVMMPVGGNPNRIAWRTEYASLAAMEEATAKLMADPKYLSLLSKGGANFIAGSVNDSIWRTI